MTSRRSYVALAAVLTVSSGCQVPRFDGPQIQEPPPGFTLQPATHSSRPTFPDHEVTFHTAWVHTDLGGVSLIYVDEHPVVFGVDDVLAAREAGRTAEMDPDAVFGEIEAIRVDGRDAWGWFEKIESPRRGLVGVSYRAVVPYDSVSYAIEFTSGEPSLKLAAPDTLRDVIGTFGIGRTTYNIPLIAIVLGAMLLFVSILRSRSRERSDRLRSINLVKIEKKEEEGQPAPAGRPPSPPAPPGTDAGPERPTPPPPDPSPRDPGAGS